MLAYSAGADIVSCHIYLKPLAGGNSIQLSDDEFDDTAPDWSPDGARIVYTAYRAGEPCRFMVAATPAAPARQIARCQGQERSRPCGPGAARRCCSPMAQPRPSRRGSYAWI